MLSAAKLAAALPPTIAKLAAALPSYLARSKGFLAKSATALQTYMKEYMKEAFQLLWQLHYPSLTGTAWLTVGVLLTTCAFVVALLYIDLGCLHLTTSRYLDGKVLAAAAQQLWAKCQHFVLGR